MSKHVVFKTLAFPTISETFVVKNIIEAIKNGFEVTILTNNKKSLENSSQKELLRQYNVLKKTRTFSMPKRKAGRYLKAFFLLLNPVLTYYFLKYIKHREKKSLSYLFLLKFYLPYRKATAFHVHFATAIEPLFELKEIGFLKSNLYVSFHGYDGHFLPKGEEFNNLKANFEKFVTEITVNTEFLKNKLITKGLTTSKISVVPYGIDFNDFKMTNSVKINEENIHIISVGRLVAFKGHQLGVRVVKLLVDKGYKVNYSILGEGPELTAIKKLIEDYKLNEHITLYGKSSQAEIKEALNNNHIFLMTSTVDSTGRREDFGVVSLEAQAMELPVVGFKSGGFPETLIDGKTGFLVQDQDVEEMASAVEKLINDRAMLQQMGKNAREHVLENFSFEKTTKKYLDLYK